MFVIRICGLLDDAGFVVNSVGVASIAAACVRWVWCLLVVLVRCVYWFAIVALRLGVVVAYWYRFVYMMCCGFGLWLICCSVYTVVGVRWWFV